MTKDLLILASTSAIRATILRAAGIAFETIDSKFDEKSCNITHPKERCTYLSRRKAQLVAGRYPDRYIIGADTVGEYEGTLLEKPLDEDQAYTMLRTLSGHKHIIHTSVSLARNREIVTKTDTALVTMRELSDNEIREYIATGEPMRHAGAYAAQGKAKDFITKIEGDRQTVEGLSVKILKDLILKFSH